MKNTTETLQKDVDTLQIRQDALANALAATAVKITEKQNAVNDGKIEHISQLSILKGESASLTDALSNIAAQIDSKQIEMHAATEDARRAAVWQSFSEMRAAQNKARAALNADIARMDALYKKTLAALTASQDAVNAATHGARDALGISAQAFNIEAARREAAGQLGPLSQCDKTGAIGAELSAALFHNAIARAERQDRAQLELDTQRARELTNRRELETQARVTAST
jgi:hypothetical protein